MDEMPQPALSWWRQLPHRLYLRIYLAVLASLLLAMIIFGWIAHQHSQQMRLGPSLEPFAELAAKVLPPASSSAQIQEKALVSLRMQVHADLCLFSKDGELIASAGRPLQLAQGWQKQVQDSSWLTRHPPTFALKLPDQRWLVGQRVHPPRRAPMGLLNGFLFAAFMIALGAYPVVRRLTARLERLQSSVQTWGQGQLSTRVVAEGKDEVARLAHSFNQAAARIEALVQAQKSLLANASHELRSPLARIRMALELLDGPGADTAKVKQELTRNMQELDQLIDEILLSSRLDAGSSDHMQVEDVDVVGLLAEECARLDAALNLLEGCSDGDLHLQGNAKLLRRMLRNLLENARRHAPPGAVPVAEGEDPICACLRRVLRGGQAWLELDICDRGPGVPEAEREQIFTPFYRLPGASEAEGGVGLGLALVRQIAHRHGGSVVCLGRDGGGSCFRVSLPLAGPG